MDLTLDNQKWLICHKTKPNQIHLFMYNESINISNHRIDLNIILKQCKNIHIFINMDSFFPTFLHLARTAMLEEVG